MSRRFIVIDTNVLISAVLSSKGTAYQAFAKVIQTWKSIEQYKYLIITPREFIEIN